MIPLAAAVFKPELRRETLPGLLAPQLVDDGPREVTAALAQIHAAYPNLVEEVLLPQCDAALDLHSGGKAAKPRRPESQKTR